MYKPFNFIQTSFVRSVYIYSFRLLLYDLKVKISFNLKVIFKKIVSVPDSAKVPVNLNGKSGEREYS